MVMPDREKVIRAYECVITRGKSVCECGKCDYHIKDSAVFFCDNQRVLTDVLELLKEHGAKTGHWIYKKYDDMFMCSCCEKYSIRNDYPYCHWCGAKMEQKVGDGE